MFDIGFWEIVVVGVVALLVIGPKELPAMMRTVGVWMGKTRHFANAVKTEMEREAYRADELKRLLVEQAELVERHKKIDPAKTTIPISYKAGDAASTSPGGSAAPGILPPAALAHPMCMDAQVPQAQDAQARPCASENVNVIESADQAVTPVSQPGDATKATA